jgi:3-oxoadipate enol-lactonase
MSGYRVRPWSCLRFNPHGRILLCGLDPPAKGGHSVQACPWPSTEGSAAMPTARANGITLNYEVHGEGEPLLLINGLADDISAWVNQIEAFAQQHTIIAFDNRGIGDSDMPLGDYTTAQMAEDAIGLLDALAIDRAHVLGTSMGGMIAQELAIAFPERVAKLVLCCTCCEPSEANRRLYRFWETAARKLGLGEMMREVMLWCFTAEYFQLRKAEAAETEEAFAGIRQPLDAYLSQLRALQTHNATARLGAITAPTLVLGAPHDLLFPPSQLEQLHRGIPHSTLRFTAHGGHSFRREVPDEFNAAVRGFLAS